MKVTGSQGGTVSTVNRKPCLHCGTLEDEISTCMLCCSRTWFDYAVFCTVCGKIKKNKRKKEEKSQTLIALKIKKMVKASDYPAL